MEAASGKRQENKNCAYLKISDDPAGKRCRD
jgi:hypothetical protein